MKKTIDCLLIGHNEVDFEKYVGDIEKMGGDSGAYRDLNLSFIRYKNRSYNATGIFNRVCGNTMSPGKSMKPIRDCEYFSATIAYLGTYLARRGFTFDYVHSFQDEKDELAEKLKEENILTIAITTTLYIVALPVIEIVHFIRKYNQGARIIIGGPFIAAQYRVADAVTLAYLFKSIGADVYVIGSQGESTLVDILNALENNSPLDKINNVYYRTEHGYASTPLLKENNKLSENMVNWDLFSHRVGESVNLRTTVSCPFSCSFCGFPEHAGTYQTADIKAVENELNLLKKIASVKNLQFIDDTLNVPGERFKDFLRMLIKNKYKFRWHSQFRCQFADEETVALMKESGCDGVFLGLESGNNSILANMNKAASVEKYLEGIALLKRYEIMTYGSFIVGFPGETAETVRDTVGLIEESQIDFYRTQLWYCDPLTPIWRQREKYNIKGSHFEWSHATMDSGEACDSIDNIFLSVEKSTWLPQHRFDFHNLFNLINQGISLDRVKNFIRYFNEGIKEKLLKGSAPGVEVGAEAMNRLEKVLCTDDTLDNVITPVVPEESGADLNFDIQFELD